MFWGLISYILWGFFPIYWKLLFYVPALEILSHRMVWSFVFYFLILILFSPRSITSLFKQDRKTWLLSALASALLTVNWGLYIFAVNSGHILEGSLAYFINPILNVVVGVLFFKEAFPFFLKLSVFFAALGVGMRFTSISGMPWVALILAVTFCSYGVTKKILKIPAKTSSVLEGMVGVIPALIAIRYFQTKHAIPFSAHTWLLLMGGGVVTGLPLFLFSYAAQRVPYSVMGMMQFIAPSLQFLVGVCIFHESVTAISWVSFSLIWTGILFYLFYQFRLFARQRKKVLAT